MQDMRGDYDELIESKRRAIGSLRQILSDKEENARLYAQSEAESIRLLRAEIEKEAEALYHLESLRQGRPPPGRPVQAPPASPIMQSVDAVRAAAARGEHVGTIDDPKTGPRPITLGELPNPARVPPSFKIEAPPHAVPLGVSEQYPQGEVKFWEGTAPADWSAVDVIDEHGHRHVRKNGRVRVYDMATMKVISDEPEVKNGSAGA
jgi:hypothetical protein